VGELRQGALEGVMADAIAAAAELPAADVRRAIMLAGVIAPVAAAALADGRSGLDRFRLALYKPVSPMLASPTHDVASALAALGTACSRSSSTAPAPKCTRAPPGFESTRARAAT
jgi:DNA ligase-1